MTLPSAHSMESHRAPLFSDLLLLGVPTIQRCQITPFLCKTKRRLSLEGPLSSRWLRERSLVPKSLVVLTFMLRKQALPTSLPWTSTYSMISSFLLNLCRIAYSFARFDAIRKARQWVASLEPRLILSSPQVAHSDPLPPRYPIDDVLRLVNPDIRKAFDMKEVVLRLVDDSRLSIFKPKYGPNMMTAWAHIMGRLPSFL
jgi:hypothetical protein